MRLYGIICAKRRLKDNISFILLAGGNEVGFATIRQGNANDSALCNTSFITIMTFKCEPRSVWDHTKSINATIFAETSVDIETCIVSNKDCSTNLVCYKGIIFLLVYLLYS